VLVPHVREVWLGPARGRLYETSGTPRFISRQDRERWVADGSPSLTEPPAETTLAPAKPLDLPSNPDALYEVLKRQAAQTDNPVPLEMFTLVGDSLRETSATAGQRAALYQVAARIPGVELVGPVRDSAGRPGTAVAITAHGIRNTLIFDPTTSALLSEESIALAGNDYGVPPGTRVGYATYLTQAIVDSDTARP
jgi:RNA polymerase sigma-70 factor (ECF subfamily)